MRIKVVVFFEKLKYLSDKESQKMFVFLIFFSIFISIIEVVGISVILPFIDILTDFSKIHTNVYYQYVFDFFEFKREVDFAIAFGLVLFLFYLFRGSVNFFYSYKMASFSHKLYAKVTQKLFRVYLSMPYQTFSGKNSSSLNKAVITESSFLPTIFNSILLILSEVLVIILLYVLLLLANWEVTLILTIFFFFKILFLKRAVSKRIKLVGEKRVNIQGELYEMLNRLFGNFKYLKFQGKSILENIENEFDGSLKEYASVGIINTSLSAAPRLLLETAGFGAIILVLVFLLYKDQGDINYALPTISLFILALYRLLPSMNRIISSYNSLLYYYKSVDIVCNELLLPKEKFGNDIVSFEESIELKAVGFCYGKNSVLSNINLIVNKGDKIAFVGESGSGKSTLVDLISGIYNPQEGEILIDGKLLNKSNLQSWRSQIGYIPQQIYLFDGTVSENVCFGRKVEEERLNYVLKQANIFTFLQENQGVNTMVGEGGISLSGGQKQRIAIARALYGDPKIMMLDEATSSLDSIIGEKIMNEIYQIFDNRTLIIISHNLDSIKGCDKVYQIKNGVINA
jgi:ATP-binding cassette, subfamily B, bacterial PglK